LIPHSRSRLQEEKILLHAFTTRINPLDEEDRMNPDTYRCRFPKPEKVALRKPNPHQVSP
jgi:hypothetical protein